jgi:hypothetical protein
LILGARYADGALPGMPKSNLMELVTPPSWPAEVARGISRLSYWFEAFDAILTK